ncbi:MAG TPA: valine--tRNA ligase [Actinomycetota bacterium]|nr:valine--tRNA ligase [Actinomycetota bacterium]
MSKKTGDLRELEERWRAYWLDSGVYRYDPTRGRDETFVVDTPPPTVSGSLHIGHVLSYTHTDLVVRYKRMRGFNTYYPMGWDDNGLPTERRVQNVFSVRCDPRLPYDPDLALEFGRKGDVISVSRPNFIELCGRVVEEDEQKFLDLFQRLGLSCDWNEMYATIDERSRYVSQLSFLNLLDKGEVVHRFAPTMWDIDFQSAVAQAEVEDREKDSDFHKIRFGVEDGGDFVIATTRPELLPGCIAVVAHPDDERYKHLFGKNAITPLFHAPVPIVADEKAEPEKGTGILMVCTFGDMTDIEWWRQLDVPPREVIGRDGRILAAEWGAAPWTTVQADAAQTHYDKLVGLPVERARRTVVEMLEGSGAIAGEPEKIRRPVKFFEKGDRPLEFVLSRQWFIPVMNRKRELIEQGRKIEWHPAMFQKRYEDWVEGLNQDWCVSRQRYFGVPIPVWYAIDAEGQIDYGRVLLPRKEDLPIDPSSDAPPGYTSDQRGQPDGFAGDPDVFDTWATSALTPRIPSGWPGDPERHDKVYPTDLRPQAHDIIRTWAFVTITRSYLEDGSVPWRHAAISGFVLDPDRKKMSKSKGNVVLPTAVLDEFGSDGVRYWAASARLGLDATADPNVFREGKRLVTKIRNASRLVLGFEGESGATTHPVDVALLARLRVVIARATDAWEAWNHALALETIEAWFWSDFTDNYLELSKTRAYAGDPSALGTLRAAHNIILRLFAPFVPFVTEEVWNSIRTSPSSIHLERWPSVEELADVSDDGTFEAVVKVLTSVRRTKSEASVSIRWPVDHLEVSGPQAALDLVARGIDDLSAAGNIAAYELKPALELADLETDVQLGEAPEKPAE